MGKQSCQVGCLSTNHPPYASYKRSQACALERNRPKQQLSAAQLCRYLNSLQQQHAMLCQSLQGTPPCRQHPPPTPSRDTRATQTLQPTTDDPHTEQRLAALEHTMQQQAACVARLAAMQASPCCHQPAQSVAPSGLPNAGWSTPTVCHSPPARPAVTQSAVQSPPHPAWHPVTACVVGVPVVTAPPAHHPQALDSLLHHLEQVLHSTEEESHDDAQRVARGLQDLHDELARQRGSSGDASSVRTSVLLEDVHAMLSNAAL